MIEYKQLKKKNGELALLNLIIGHGHWSLVSGHHRDYILGILHSIKRF